MSIVTYPLNGITYDAEDAQTYLCTRTSGVYSSDDCFDISITDDMEVTISPGLAWIKTGDYAGMSVCMEKEQTITIPLGSGSCPEYDRIVLRFDKEENETTLELVLGTAEDDATVPDITQTEEVYELGLYILYREPGTTEISISDITDTRMDEDVCGIMRDAVTGVPTKVIQASALELIEELRQVLKDVEGDTAWMLKDLYDPAGGERQVAFEDDVTTLENNISSIVEESLPFSLAVVDGTYGYYDSDGTFHSFRQPTGTATASEVLSGYTFSNSDSDGLTGTMTNRGAISKTLTPGNSYTIPQGYHNGSGTVTAKSATASASTSRTKLGSYSNNVSSDELEDYDGGTMTKAFSATSIDGYSSLSADNFALEDITVAMRIYIGSCSGNTYVQKTLTPSISYTASSGKVTVSWEDVKNESGTSNEYINLIYMKSFSLYCYGATATISYS